MQLPAVHGTLDGSPCAIAGVSASRAAWVAACSVWRNLGEPMYCCLQFMAHLWEPLRVVHKPLAVHLVSEAWGLVTHSILLWMGFSHGSHKVRWLACCT